MARTIGVKNKNILRKLVKEANAQGIVQDYAVMVYVNARMPEAAFDTWESAWSEINRLAGDYNMKGA